MTYTIWWSPMGHENGSAEVEAASYTIALSMAQARMRMYNAIGAYGAEEKENE